MSAKLPRFDARCPTCGTQFQVTSGQLRAGRGRFCSRACNGRSTSTRHGHTTKRGASPTYNSWAGMLQRCTNPKHPKYPAYGARGVTVCAEWMEFQNFLRDMGERPDGMTLDRKDNSGNYEPENCRWATRAEQQNNRGVNIRVSYAGQEYTLAELAVKLGVSWKNLAYRVQHWPQQDWGLKPRARRYSPA